MKTKPVPPPGFDVWCLLFLATALLAQETKRAFVFEADVQVPMRDGV